MFWLDINLIRYLHQVGGVVRDRRGFCFLMRFEMNKSFRNNRLFLIFHLFVFII